ncbi:DUF2975 domain-containing protein [Flavobacterium sp. DGU38]|uniref:DUF2975 domain-containing protein n=1 Tax=Flavobacterium calami TaxID=3139144 RepID=A0ABU9ITX1_9FLAO
MKNNSRLLTVLYIISRLSFRLCQLVLLFTLCFEFIPNGSFKNFDSSTHHSKGYPVKAQIQLNIPDTLINYKGKFNKGIVLKSKNEEANELFNEVKKDTQYVKTYQINSFEIYNDKEFEIKKETINPTVKDYNAEIKLTLNPKDFFFKSVLILKNYLSLILILFVVFQFMRFFKQLREDFVFNDLLNKRIKNIGYSLIAYQLVNLVASVITMQYISGIIYTHSISSIEESKFNFMNLTTIPEYNFEVLFFGLCCLVLAKLLNYGYDLQNENDLTI